MFKQKQKWKTILHKCLSHNNSEKSFCYTQNGVKPDFSQMTNYAFQGVGRTLNLITALAIHLIKCAAKANCRLDLVPSLKAWG